MASAIQSAISEVKGLGTGREFPSNEPALVTQFNGIERDTLDYVIIGEGINLVGSAWPLVFSEAERVLKPGGALLVMFPKFEPQVGLEWEADRAAGSVGNVLCVADAASIAGENGTFAVLAYKIGNRKKVSKPQPQGGRGEKDKDKDKNKGGNGGGPAQALAAATAPAPEAPVPPAGDAAPTPPVDSTAAPKA